MTDNKKILKNEYRERKIIGGIYRVTNTQNGMYLLDSTPNLQAKQNAFDFMVSTGVCFHHKLKSDWAVSGGRTLKFEILEELVKKKDQTPEGFHEDLDELLQMWSEKLESSNRY